MAQRDLETSSSSATSESKTESIVSLAGVDKTYRTGRVELQALRGIDLVVEKGEMLSIVGPSGSGKSTLLNVLTGIDRPTGGSIHVAGSDLVPMSEDELASWRGANVGIVFQFFQLIPTLTALENVTLPLDFAHRGTLAERVQAARERLDLVGLTNRIDHFPSELSGGEQQRVALARAVVMEPQLLVADEPTGNLDTETATAMLEVLVELNRAGTTIVYVTHDRSLSQRAGRIVRLRDGKIEL